MVQSPSPSPAQGVAVIAAMAPGTGEPDRPPLSLQLCDLTPMQVSTLTLSHSHPHSCPASRHVGKEKEVIFFILACVAIPGPKALHGYNEVHAVFHLATRLPSSH